MSSALLSSPLLGITHKRVGAFPTRTLARIRRTRSVARRWKGRTSGKRQELPNIWGQPPERQGEGRWKRMDRDEWGQKALPLQLHRPHNPTTNSTPQAPAVAPKPIPPPPPQAPPAPRVIPRPATLEVPVITHQPAVYTENRASPPPDESHPAGHNDGAGRCCGRNAALRGRQPSGRYKEQGPVLRTGNAITFEAPYWRDSSHRLHQ